MILSRKLNLLFIKGRKVGGTSVEMALAPLCGADDIVTAITQIDERARLTAGGGARNFAEDPEAERRYLEAVRQSPTSNLPSIRIPPGPYVNHMPLRRVIELQGEAIAGLEIVGVERDPYSKILSWANMRLGYEAYQVGGDTSRPDVAALRRRAQEAVDKRQIGNVLNLDFYKNLAGNLSARLMRYADLEQEVRALLSSRGLETSEIFPHAKRGILANTLLPSDYFERSHLDIINDFFSEEFELFGYRKL